MKHLVIQFVSAVISIALILGCDRTTEFGEPVEPSAQALSVSQAREVSNRGRTIVVIGTIKEVCKDEGCWFALVDDRSEITTRFTINGIGIPVISEGTVLVKGVVMDTVIGNNHVPELHARGVKFVTSQP